MRRNWHNLFCRKIPQYSLHAEKFTHCAIGREIDTEREKEVSASESIKNALSDSVLVSYLLSVHRSWVEVTMAAVLHNHLKLAEVHRGHSPAQNSQ